MDKSLAFGVCLNSVTRWGPLVQTVLYLQDSFYMRLALKLFRREPAISKFDWNFSATHTSSPHFSTCVGSGLQPHTKSPYSDSLSLRLRLFNLTLHVIVTRRFILQKARHYPLTGFDYL